MRLAARRLATTISTSAWSPGSRSSSCGSNRCSPISTRPSRWLPPRNRRRHERHRITPIAVVHDVFGAAMVTETSAAALVGWTRHWIEDRGAERMQPDRTEVAIWLDGIGTDFRSSGAFINATVVSAASVPTLQWADKTVTELPDVGNRLAFSWPRCAGCGFREWRMAWGRQRMCRGREADTVLIPRTQRRQPPNEPLQTTIRSKTTRPYAHTGRLPA